MVANPIRVLLIEDNPGDALLIEDALQDVPTPAFDLEQVDRLASGLQRLTQGGVDVILLDLSLPDSHGLDTLTRTCQHAPAIPVIVLTGLADNVLEVRAVQAGAQDFLLKNALDGHLLARAIRYAIDRKQAEEKLRQTNAYLENLINYANSPIIVWDPQFHITRFNHAFEFLTGRAESEVVGQSLEILFPPALAEQSMALIRKTLSGERWETVEIKIVHRDQSIRTVLWNSATLFGPDGQTPVATIAQGQDITERKRAEEALRESEAHVHLALWAANAGAWEWDLATSENIWSEELWKLYGLEPHSCQPSYEAWRQTIHPADRDQVEQIVTAAARAGTELNAEWRVIDRDGTERWLMSRGQSLRNAAGQVARVVGIVIDITDRKQAAEQIQRYEFIANTAAESMTLINQQHVFEAVNDAYCRSRGRSRAELVGRSVADVWGEAHYRSNIRPYLDQCFAGQIVRYEDSFTFDSDRPRYYQVGMYPYRTAPDGPVTSVVVVNFDITDLKQAEAQRAVALKAVHDLNAELEQRVADRTRQLTEANTQLAELDRLKDQFISRISHELRTPLTNIIIYLDLLDTGKPEKRTRYMQVLKDQSALLQKLIESLLEVTQLSVNMADLQVAPTDLNRLVASLVSDTTPRAAQRALTVKCTLAPELPLVSADPLLLAQALSHLATNALNYTPANGTIDLNTAQVVEQGVTWVTFTIRDTGPGIAPDDLPHIFERFYRGRAAADYKTPGAGMGLSLSRDILTSLGGRLTAVSTGVPGQGAAFTAWLKPALEASNEA